jgi:acyl-CoA-binding protein
VTRYRHWRHHRPSAIGECVCGTSRIHGAVRVEERRADGVHRRTTSERAARSTHVFPSMQRSNSWSRLAEMRATTAEFKEEHLFERACDHAAALRERLSMTERLRLYSFYKQAVCGDAGVSAASWASVIEQAKHQAWTTRRGMRWGLGARLRVGLARRHAAPSHAVCPSLIAQPRAPSRRAVTRRVSLLDRTAARRRRRNTSTPSAQSSAARGAPMLRGRRRCRARRCRRPPH